MTGLQIGKVHGSAKPVILPTSLLSKHVAILGSIGSGKTVAAKVLLEEATLSGIPSIIIDPQGDIAKIALSQTMTELKKNNVDEARAQLLDEKAEFRIWTPASELGLPLSINPFSSAPSVGNDFDENSSSSIAALDLMAAGFAAICGYPQSNKMSQIKAFLNQVLLFATKKKNLPESFNELANMVANIDDHLDSLGLDSESVTITSDLISEADRKELSRRLRSLNTGVNRLLFQSGVALEPETLVTPIETGYTPVNIILINTLPDEDTKQKFVAELSRSLYSWGMRDNSPDSLKLVYFVDEAHQFLPPTQSPPSKAPLMNLFRRGRHCGIACIVATQQLTDIDYKALGNVNTKFIGRVTDPRERDKVREMFANATNPKESLDTLPNLQAGEFMLLCPELDTKPIAIDIRWLYRQHGRPITDKEIKKVVNSKQRKWAKEVQEGLEHRLSGLRTFQPHTTTEGFISSMSEVEEDNHSEESGSASSSIDSQDSVFAGDVTQRTIHGAENVNINFNLQSIENDEMNEIMDTLKKGFSIVNLQVSNESVNFRDDVLTKLEDAIVNSRNETKNKFQFVDDNVEIPIVAWKFRFVYSLLIVFFGGIFINIVGTSVILESAFGNWLRTSGFLLFSVLIFASFIYFLSSELIVITANNNYIQDSFKYLDKREELIRGAIKNFRISSNYSNMYHQTQESEFEVIGYIEEFSQVISRRRAHRKFATKGKESAEWISDTQWDQIISISLEEYIKIIMGEDLDFDSQTWAKREVLIWD